jgi:hypothetical protein
MLTADRVAPRGALALGRVDVRRGAIAALGLRGACAAGEEGCLHLDAGSRGQGPRR